MAEQIFVTSHVSRDFQQNAAYFNSLAKVMWEYISNSIDNARDDVQLEVTVGLRQDSLVIEDNGIGMDRDDLARFFQMHGRNAQRALGKRVRGKFGTGKTAAFGIASKLLISSVKDGRQNAVSLAIDDIQKAQDGAPFPVRTLVDNKPIDAPPGTTVTVSGFKVPLDLEKAIRYVEKQLSRMRIRAAIYINEHRCQHREPPATHEWRVRSQGDVRDRVGDVEMVLKSAPTPLPRDEIGIDILSNGIWHESTLAEISGEQSNRIFGYVDVPLLDEDERYGIPAFDNTRNGTLNRSHPVVTALLYWIQQEVRRVQRELQGEAKAQKESADAKKLKQRAKDFAALINDDFRGVIDDLDELRRIIGQKRRVLGEKPGDGIVLPGEGIEPSELTQGGPEEGNGARGKSPPPPGPAERPGPDLRQGTSTGNPGTIANHPGKRRSHGEFSIEFARETREERRSHYDRDTRTIYVNMDHPQIIDALRLGSASVESENFLQMVFEIACVEYAQALQFERLESGETFDAADAVWTIGEVIDRVSRKFSSVSGS